MIGLPEEVWSCFEGGWEGGGGGGAALAWGGGGMVDVLVGRQKRDKKNPSEFSQNKTSANFTTRVFRKSVKKI